MPVEPIQCRRSNQQRHAETTMRARRSSELQVELGAMGDGAEISSSTMAAQRGLQLPASYMLPAYGAGQQDAEYRRAAEPLGHGGAAGDISREVAERSRPSYVPPSQRRRQGLAEREGLPSPGGSSLALLPPSAFVPSYAGPPSPVAPSYGRPGGLLPPPPASTYSSPDHGPGGLPLPPPGSTYSRPDRATPLEDSSSMAAEPVPDNIPFPFPSPPRFGLGIVPKLPKARKATEPAQEAYRRRTPPPRLAVSRLKKEHQHAAQYLTACCLLSCLLALAIGFALLVVYLRYDPRPPRMRVATATLQNSTVAGRAHNYSLSVEVRIDNPSTQLHVVLRYVQLDLYFNGSLVGTQAVWQAPIHEAPGDSVLRSVRLPVSVARDRSAWRVVTEEGGGGLELLLVGSLHLQLNFGRRLPLRFWVRPTCTLWLDPLRGGALRQSSC
ncbi:unnamed protein product [Urochloa decumbens]|uniref:Late embryogenesis abundant protein LEA-2 subgroup domain-containing protein n=1 Tax=Urochloa decumbens TaxID=240449 RepID=A0ABC9D8X2_9POAL